MTPRLLISVAVWLLISLGLVWLTRRRRKMGRRPTYWTDYWQGPVFGSLFGELRKLRRQQYEDTAELTRAVRDHRQPHQDAPQGSQSKPDAPAHIHYGAPENLAHAFEQQLKAGVMTSGMLNEFAGRDCVLMTRDAGVVAKVMSFRQTDLDTYVALQAEPGTGFLISQSRLHGEPFIQVWRDADVNRLISSRADSALPAKQVEVSTKMEFVERRTPDMVYFHFNEPRAVRLIFLPEYVKKARMHDSDGWDFLAEKTSPASADAALGDLAKFDLIDNPPYLATSAALLCQMKDRKIIDIARPFGLREIGLYPKSYPSMRRDQYFALAHSPVYFTLEDGFVAGIFENRVSKSLYAWQETYPPTFACAPNPLFDSWGTELISCKDKHYSKRYWADFIGRRIARVAVALLPDADNAQVRGEAGLLIATEGGQEILIASSRLSLQSHEFHLTTPDEISPEYVGKIVHVDV